jgi:hypothetical protein
MIADETDASSAAAANVSESTDVELDNHPLLAHLRLYIFSDVYLISELKQLAYEKLTACFVDINRPQTLDRQRAVIDVLRVAFLKVPLNDSLLAGWPIMRHTASINFDFSPLFTIFLKPLLPCARA